MNDKFSVYFIYDVVTERYSLPFYQVNDKSAIRECANLANKDSIKLYCCGDLSRSSENGLSWNVSDNSTLIKDFTTENTSESK